MLRKGLIIGAVLFLLGAMVGCAAESGQPTKETSVDLALTDGVTIEVEQAAKETNIFTLKGRVSVDAYHYDAATGTYISFYHHESSNLVVDIGKDWIEDQLGDSPGTDPAKWISLSTDATAPAAGWTQIISEITTGGLARAAGTYGDTGVGTWTIAATFTATAPHTNVQLTGLQWSATAGSDNNLLAANQFTPVTLNSNDMLTITWQLSVS